MEQLSSDELKAIPVLVGPLSRMGERVAGLEGRLTTAVGGMQESIAVIRKAQHDTANHIQGILLAEQRCAAGLEFLSKELLAHKESVASQAALLTTQIAVMGGDIKTILTDRARVEGGWWAFLKICLVIGFVTSGMGAAIGIIISFANNPKFLH